MVGKKEKCYIERCNGIVKNKCEDCSIKICERHTRIHKKDPLQTILFGSLAGPKEVIVCPSCFEKRHQLELIKKMSKTERKKVQFEWKPRTKKPWWFPI